MRVLVCGGRDFRDKGAAFDELDRIHAATPITTIIQGGANGADYLAHRWAEKMDLHEIEFNANWVEHGRKAGPLRNQNMIDIGKPDLVVAFRGGRGTADMVRRAEAAGIPVLKPPPKLSADLDEPVSKPSGNPQ